MNIIQDLAKIINHRITNRLLIFIGLISSIIISFIIGITSNINNSTAKVYIISSITDEQQKLIKNEAQDTQNEDSNIKEQQNIENSSSPAENTKKGITKIVNVANKSVILGSSKGKYFYYKGCEPSNLSPKYLVYYKTESQAISAGKTLHSKCR